ncbi:MAG: hypothetical protein HYU36_14500 [Planctomycetes bacterium]|nr:hypothetical protein [Planctomycetota bacterium]
MLLPLACLNLALSLVIPIFGEPAMDLKGVRVMVGAGYFDLLNIPAVKRLKDAGAEVRQGNLADLKWETAQHFHLIIGVGQNPPENPAKRDEAVNALEQFVKAGGGLLFFRHAFESQSADQYLKPFGASLPWELIQDPAHSFRSPTGFNLPYAFTESITAGHAVTEGVVRVWYSAEKRFLFHTSPLVVSEVWTVLVKAAPEASSMRVGGLHEEHQSGPGGFAAAPPIAAARELGAGRIVLVGISPMEVFLGQGLPAYQDVAMERGDGLRPSHTRRLCENAVRWLAEKALASKEVGQGDLTPVVNNWAKPDVPDWGRDPFGGDLCTNPARGVIGAHSTLSDGGAAPDAFIAKAKSLRLQWLAFTERLEDFSKGKWESLRKTCKEASTPNFAALPGLDYADAAGARYVVFGDFDWPPEKVFSPDQKRIVEPTWWFNIQCAPNGPYDAGHSPLRPWDFSLYDFWPVWTTRDGRLVDEALESYRYLHGIQDDPFPMAVDMALDEAQLEAAAGRSCNFITQDQPGDLTKFYRDLNYYGSSRGFVSDGPRVTDWRACNQNRITGGSWWLPGTEQYRVKLAVRSDAAITDVRIHDGPTLLRRFCPNQDKVTLTFDLPHDQQRNLVAEITDANGKRAVTGGLFVRDWLNWRFMCSDRGNSICDAIQVDDAGAYLTGPTAPYQRKMTVFGICAGYGERHFVMLPPDFDGGMRPVGMHIMPRFQVADQTFWPPNCTLEARMGVPVCSRDGLLQHDSVVGYFPDDSNASAWSPKRPPKDIEGVAIHYRYLNITPRAHDPGVVLLEGSLRFDHPAKLESLSLFSIFHSSQPGEADHYALVTPETTVAGLAAGEPFNASGRMAPGSYACVFPSLWGSTGILALDDGYQAGVYAQTMNVHVNGSLADMPRSLKAGEELNYRLLLLHGRARERPNTAEWESFAKLMGLRGPPGYQVKDVRAGQVKATRFLLELQPQDGGFAGTVTAADLPARLPVRVADMNPNWTFAWFDLDRREWYPSAVDPAIRQGYFSLDTRRGHHRFFAGHPVLADQPDVRMAVFSDGKSEIRATLNNVGDDPLKVTVRLHPALGEAQPHPLELAPGGFVTVTFPISTR